MRRATLLAGLSLVLAPGAAAADVRPDRSFARDGHVTTAFARSDAYAAGVLAQPNGKIVIAGQVAPKRGTAQILVARYGRDGELDRRFGRNGIFRSALPHTRGPFNATALARDRSRKRLVIAGGYGLGSMLALRLGPDGRLDRSFGRAGVATVAAGGIAESVALDPEGRILLGGSNANLNGRPMVVARLTRRGSIDRSFGQAGVVQPLFWDADIASSAGVAAIHPAADGGLTAMGHLDYIGSDGHGSAGVFSLDSSGEPVTGFGTAGHAEVDFPDPPGTPAFWFPCAMAVDAAGAITISGDGQTSAGTAVLTARLSAAGALEPSFGTGGRSVAGVPGVGSFTTCGMTTAPRGALVVGVGRDLLGLDAAGAADPGFGPGGRYEIARPRGVVVNAVARSGAGRLVAAGSAGEAIYVGRFRVPAR